MTGWPVIALPTRVVAGVEFGVCAAHKAASIRGLAVVNPPGRQVGEAVAAWSAARKDR
ncbi:hypothetical protein [Mycobacterium sp. 1165178.9]|uniref:hypothetical protein n=1 Tax=Mycobacterium sp. 1165178.9 TaxID=1834070 RepID=UPI0012EA06DF|nr:hypothetical protein [Mycobacterium sp. 1165178.9]